MVEVNVMYDTRPVPDEAPPVDDSTTDGDLGVQVHLFAAARAAAQTDVLTVPAGTLDEVLASCGRESPALREVLPRCSYLVNEIAVTDEAARLLPGDRLDVLPPFAGG